MRGSLDRHLLRLPRDGHRVSAASAKVWDTPGGPLMQLNFVCNITCTCVCSRLLSFSYPDPFLFGRTQALQKKGCLGYYPACITNELDPE